MRDGLATSDIIGRPLHDLRSLIIERLEAEVKRLLFAIFAFIIFERILCDFTSLRVRGVLLLVWPFLLF